MMKTVSVNKMIMASLITIFLVSACQSTPKNTSRKAVQHSKEQQAKLDAARSKIDVAAREYGKILAEIHGEPVGTSAQSLPSAPVKIPGTKQEQVFDAETGEPLYCTDGDAEMSCTGKCPC